MSRIDVRFGRDAFGRLYLVDQTGATHERVAAVRSFPLSAPDLGVSICDPSGQEVLWIADLADLSPEARAIVEHELDRNEFQPSITRIHRISSEASPCEFDVETDRGRTKFTLDSDESIRKIGLYRMIVTDAQGVRYHVPDLRRLDNASRRAFEHHL